MAGGSVVPETDGKAEPDKDVEVEEDEDEAKEDDKLYCVCKTRYDEDRVMIACDRCVFLGLRFVHGVETRFFFFDADVMSGIILNALICRTWKWISWINSFVHLASKVCSLRVSSRIYLIVFPPQATLSLTSKRPTRNDVFEGSSTPIHLHQLHVTKPPAANSQNIALTNVASSS
jgi:hypothetical protein